MIKAVVFDLDSTLVHYGDTGTLESIMLASLERLGVHVPDPAAMTLEMSQDRRAIWRDEAAQRRERVNMRGAFAGILERAARRVGLDVPREVCGLVGHQLLERLVESVSAYDDTEPCLKALRAGGMKLGLATNGDGDIQRGKLARCRLGEYFDCVIAEGEFGRGKPDAEVFHAVCAGMDVLPGEACMVGDNLGHDVLAAMACGLKGVLIRRGKNEGTVAGVDAVVGNLAEFMAWLKPRQAASPSPG